MEEKAEWGEKDKLSESVERRHIMMWMDYGADQRERWEYGYTRCKGGCA